MAQFIYEAKTRGGEVRTGTVEADDEAAVTVKLRAQNLTPVKVRKKGLLDFSLAGAGGSVGQKDLVIFTRQFATMIDAGLPLVQCLDILSSQGENPTFAKVLRSVKNDVEGGMTFSEALSKHPKIFDVLFCNLVRAGEVGGILDTILQRLAAYIEKNAKLQRQVKGALTYPVGVLVLAIVVIGVMMVFVIPTFEKMFKDFGGTVAVYLAEGHSLDGPTPRLLLGVIAAIYAVSLGYALQIRGASRRRLQRLISVSIAGDLLAWTVLAYATGGAASPLSAFFGLSTLTAALVLGGNGTLWTAVTGLGAYGTLGMLMSARVLRPLADQMYALPSPIETTYQMVVTVTAVVLIAAIGGSLADRLVLTGDALVRSEASRANLSALYEDVLRSIPVALVTYDADGRIDGANPYAASLLGVDAATLLGRALTEVLPFVPTEVIAGSRGASGDATLDGRAGSLPVGFHAAPLYDREGATRGGLVVVDDRSQEEKLRDAVQQAERFAVLGRLAAGLAHEIRNPLGAIQGCVELVRETASLDTEERDLLTTVTRDTARLNDLVTDMLQFARPRPPDLQPTDLAGLARDVVALARTSGPIATVRLTLEADPEVIALVDGAQVRQVLWNLLRNAAQVSRPGTEVDLEVRSHGDHAAIMVLDRGPGVPAEVRDKIFEAFYSGTARGTGLGLAIVKRIADAHGGSVEYRPREGGGSVFAFIVPRTPGPARA